MPQVVNGAGSVTRAGVFLYPVGHDMTADDLNGFLMAFQSQQSELHKKMDWYLGKHPILQEPAKQGNRPDNRIVDNLPYSNVDTFNGYFIGKNPQITLDSETGNASLQDWQNANSFQDRLAEISKQVDIYGRAFAFIYQNEQSETKMTYSDPETSFMIYDDTVEQNPLAFVRFAYDEQGQINGRIYFADHSSAIAGGTLTGNDDQPNLYGLVPAVEFISNDERQGLNDQIFALADSLDHALSQKANQVEYFDNAYLVIKGLQLPEDDQGNPQFTVAGNQLIYAPAAEATDAGVEFVSKPDGDTMQENLINRMIEQIYNVTGVVNFNDSRITGNMTGKALERLLQRMSNRAVFKRTKFTEALRELYRVVFSAQTIKGVNADDWSKLQFKFYENLPADYADEANTAKALEGIVSKETQLKVLEDIVDDPKAEIKRMQDEQANSIKNAQKAAGAVTDSKVGD